MVPKILAYTILYDYVSIKFSKYRKRKRFYTMIWVVIDEKLAEGKGVIIVSHEDEQDRLKNTAQIISI